MKEFKEVLDIKLDIIEEIISYDTEVLQEPIFDDIPKGLSEGDKWKLKELVTLSMAELQKLKDKLNTF